MPLSQGQTLNNRYRIVKLLGQGGYGAVYRAWDIHLDRPVALKENLDISPESQRQFKTEAQLLFDLSHPGLPKVSDCFSISGYGQYLVMEFIEGDDLQEILDRNGGPLAETQVLHWIDQVCDVLAYLHGRKPPIIHRDIKPGNIKITPGNKIKLVDFGIAKTYDPGKSTTKGARGVTPGYSPIEQYISNGSTDSRTDIYALGATLFTILTGQVPPEAPERNLGTALPAPNALNPAISAQTNQAILKALEMLPERRFQSAAEFQAVINGANKGTAGHPSPQPAGASTGSAASSYITALKRFVHVEYDTQTQQVRQMWALPVNARVAEGEAISDVEIVQSTWTRMVLRCRDNLSKFRMGDNLLLNQGNPMIGGYSCILEEDHDNELVIIPGYGVRFEGFQNRSGWVLDRDVVDIRHILLGTLQLIADTPKLESFFRSLLAGQILPRINPGLERASSGKIRTAGLNPSQTEAFSRAYATENYYLIQGPPGTGKTWVLAHLAATLAREGQRVLITAFTHRAINNALRKIVKTTGYPKVIKVGRKQYADDLVWEDGRVLNFDKFSSGPYSSTEQGLIVGGTCFAVQTSSLNEVEFDTVIFDEASQVTLPLAFAGMLAGRKHIFIGDHRQMAPVVTGQHTDEWVSRSIFETLYQYAPGTMLDITYRMCAEINSFPSQYFYGGRLVPSNEARARRLKLNRKPRNYAQLLDPDVPDIFGEISHTRRGMRSPEEAEVAAGIAIEAVYCGVAAEEIAIVAPYRAQGRIIRKRLRQLASPDMLPEIEKIVVDTVERIQGQERDIVIISLTTSDPVHAAKRAEFFFQPNRLNVAITRPRVKRIVLGSPYLFSAQLTDTKLNAWLENFRALYKHSHVIVIN